MCFYNLKTVLNILTIYNYDYFRNFKIITENDLKV